MRALVFAAGLGERLRPLTQVLPKPVVPLLHRPLCWFALNHLARIGAREVVLNTHYLADRVEAAITAAPPIELAIRFARESALLGTAGGVKNAVAVQSRVLGRALGEDEPLIAFNGDILFAPNLADAIALHRESGAVATMVVREDPNAARFGAIEIDETQRVRRMLAKPDGTWRATMFTGVHVLSARAIADLPDEGCIVRQGYRRWLARGETISAHLERSPWRDLGTPREYLRAHLDLLSGAIAWPGLDARSEAVHPSACIASGANVIDCAVGAGARVAAGVQLERCVVWPGTTVERSASDRILAEGIALDAR